MIWILSYCENNYNCTSDMIELYDGKPTINHLVSHVTEHTALSLLSEGYFTESCGSEWLLEETPVIEVKEFGDV